MDLYTWYQWLTFFYFYSFLGWIFESSYVSVKQRRLVNRGFLRIPLLPLYGSGALMMLTGKWIRPGVYTVEEFDPDPFLDALDRYGLPRSESHDPKLVD